MDIILASKSPRRREILENLGVDFKIITADTDESSSLTDGAALAEELSARKAQAVYESLKAQGLPCADTLIIGCDTVVCCDGTILGKPTDRADAERILKMLSGRTHEVISGLTLLLDGKLYTSHEITRVLFDPLEQSEITEYVSTGEPDDKAGAYGIQGLASRFIRGIEGCYFNVVGLPVNLLYRMTKQIGVTLTGSDQKT